MSIELQKIDCNCSDCVFMKRDLKRFDKSLEFHKDIQMKAYELETDRIENLILEKLIKGTSQAATQIYKELCKRRFVFDKSAAQINYGHCEKFDKPVSFIPNTCQLETQKCFEHRRG